MLPSHELFFNAPPPNVTYIVSKAWKLKCLVLFIIHVLLHNNNHVTTLAESIFPLTGVFYSALFIELILLLSHSIACYVFVPSSLFNSLVPLNSHQKYWVFIHVLCRRGQLCGGECWLNTGVRCVLISQRVTARGLQLWEACGGRRGGGGVFNVVRYFFFFVDVCGIRWYLFLWFGLRQFLSQW